MDHRPVLGGAPSNQEGLPLLPIPLIGTYIVSRQCGRPFFASLGIQELSKILIYNVGSHSIAFS